MKRTGLSPASFAVNVTALTPYSKLSLTKSPFNIYSFQQGRRFLNYAAFGCTQHIQQHIVKMTLCLDEHRKRRICREIWSSKPGNVSGWYFGWTVTERGRTLLMRY